ncbi:hypothetical protein LTR78_009547 [Recurvomyces mirabilis]|uniref:BTB domain-containing protein n=1 Tax=Recurvomyces mirabilis TaxID=574656 RepID=A0AAE0TPD4_9PEZI|nr:hypothetical protein LTR78_009547 [Recurvomyces mirabilis]KAK5149998.1 hypothetical protein LTS14_010470 [Recurvomyces mirabilis]
MITFPTFEDGDVKIVLAPDSASDILILHSSKLAEASSYFHASLKKPEWSQNRSELSTMFKSRIMMLDFRYGDTFPLLASKEANDLLRPGEWRERAARYEASINSSSSDRFRLLQRSHESEFVIGAYKLGFALLYNTSVKLPSGTLALSRLIPALTTFADAYDLIDVLRPRVLATLLAGPLDVNDLIAENPFAMLYAAYHLRSASMYWRGMRHAIALHDLSRHSDDMALPSVCQYFSNLSLVRISFEVTLRHKAYRERMNTMYESLLHDIELPNHFECQIMTNNVAIAIFRDRVLKNFGSRQAGIVKLSMKGYNISQLMKEFGGHDWMDGKVSCPSYSYTSLALQSCFDQALDKIRKVFPPEDMAKGVQSMRIKALFPQIESRYLANIKFEPVSKEAVLNVLKYPWEKRDEKDEVFNMRNLGELLKG